MSYTNTFSRMHGEKSEWSSATGLSWFVSSFTCALISPCWPRFAWVQNVRSNLQRGCCWVVLYETWVQLRTTSLRQPIQLHIPHLHRTLCLFVWRQCVSYCFVYVKAGLTFFWLSTSDSFIPQYSWMVLGCITPLWTAGLMLETALWRKSLDHIGERPIMLNGTDCRS